MSGWYVYENTPHGKARIHYGPCPFCNYGKGIAGKTSRKYDEWHGPFTTKNEAFAKARKLGKKDVRTCTFCEKQY